MLARHRRVVQEGVVALGEVAVLDGWFVLAVLGGWFVLAVLDVLGAWPALAVLDALPGVISLAKMAALDGGSAADTVEPETGI